MTTIVIRAATGELLERLRSAPGGRVGEIEMRRRRSIVLGLTRTLQVMVEQISTLESEIADAVASAPDGEIFRSFVRSPNAVICAATLRGEIGDCRARYPHRDTGRRRRRPRARRREIGEAQERHVSLACNQRLRTAPPGPGVEPDHLKLLAETHPL